MMKRLTVEFIMAQYPCADYPEARVRELIGKGKTLLQVLALPIPAQDRVWCLTRASVLSHPEQIQFVICCARRSLSNFESRFPDDDRPRKAIAAAAKYLKNPTEKNKIAASAAWSAACAASAAWSAWSEEQVKDLTKILKARGKK